MISKFPPNAVLTEAWYGLRGNTLGDTDMDDHRSCGFLLSAIPFILIPPLKKKKKQLVVDYFRILFFWIIFVGWVWRGGQLGAEGERQQAFRLAAPNHRVVAQVAEPVARLSVRDVLVMAPSSNAL